MKALTHFLVRYKAWIMAALAPLGGVWAVFLVALIDASFFGIPLDPVIAYYVAVDPRRTILYAVMASLGSALGSTVPYLIGYKGGEALVVKKLGQKSFARLHARSEKYGDLALIIPALMPPGFPFKAFALIAGVTEMRYPHFLLSIFVGRLLRFIILGGLIIAYGPEILSFLMAAFQHHRIATFAVIVAIAAIIVLIVRFNRSRSSALTETIVA
ncbi:MAG: VTT domain-containing protein [Candidatus Korobacteraceae bacterium]